MGVIGEMEGARMEELVRAYHIVDKVRTSYPGGFDELEEVHHMFSLQSLHHGMDGDEGTCTTHTITGKGVGEGEGRERRGRGWRERRERGRERVGRGETKC